MYYWNPSKVVWALIVMSLAFWAGATIQAFGQEAPADINVQKHYRLYVLTPEPETGVTIRMEYHLMVGTERSVSIVFGGVEGEPQPRQVMAVVGDNIFEGDRLCFVIDEVQYMAPERLLGERACFVFNPEDNTMSPINDPNNMVLEDCGKDHTTHPVTTPGARAT